MPATKPKSLAEQLGARACKSCGWLETANSMRYRKFSMPCPNPECEAGRQGKLAVEADRTRRKKNAGEA